MLFVIDELGFEEMDRQEASLFFRLITHRYGRGAVLITTNKSVRGWPELLAGDEVLATAILDRLGSRLGSCIARTKMCEDGLSRKIMTRVKRTLLHTFTVVNFPAMPLDAADILEICF